MTLTTVPEQTPDQTLIVQALYPSPYSAAWWLGQVITDVPQDSVGWLVAQGWQIDTITYDTTTTPNIPRYRMIRESLQHWQILQALLNDFTDKQNTALHNNTIRYNDVVDNWTDLIATTQDHFDNQCTTQTAHDASFLAKKDEYVTEIDTLLTASQEQLDDLEPDYSLHKVESEQLLDDLGTTELARINEAFDATLATQLQQLLDRGLYSSALAADITARNTRDRDEEIAALNDRLNREKRDNGHRLYEQQLSMRSRIIDGTNSIIVSTTNQANIDLTARQAKHDETMRLMTYQLEERNKLFVGLYGFVERRDDIGPSFENLTSVVTALGDSGGGWITP